MREAYRILPVCAGDVSGIASALYELGGMVVIHDPSGCNSTYNTHDEIRWYDMESYIFISGLNMKDAVLGNDQKFIDDIVEAFFQLDRRPRFIAICNSPVPFLNGTDFGAICRIVQSRCGVKTFYVPSNGMHDYVRGAGLAFLEYAKNMLPAPGQGRSAKGDETKKGRPVCCGGRPAEDGAFRKVRVNVLGATPLTYGRRQTVESLRSYLEEDGFDVISVWAMGSGPEELDRSTEADVDLVISDTGILAAKYLEEKYDIPYVISAPAGEKAWAETTDVLRRFGKKEGTAVTPECYNIDENRYDSGNGADRYGNGAGKAASVKVFIGEAVLSMSLAAGCREKAYVLCPFKDSMKLLYDSPGTGDTGDAEDSCRYFDGEEELMKALHDIEAANPGSAIEVFADPVYGMVLPADITLIKLPALAFSGRLYQGHFPDYFCFGKADKGRNLA